MPGRFELHKDTGGEFRFGLMTTNVQGIGTGEQRETEQACENGIKSMSRNAPGSKV